MQGSANCAEIRGCENSPPYVGKPSWDELQEKLMGYAAEVTISRLFFA
jgi:hypothetical protein